MDLSTLKPVERTIEILNPVNGQEIGVRISLVSINDERLKKVKRRIQDEKLRLEARGKNFKSEDIEENRNVLIFNAITGWDWSGDTNFHGEKPVFNLKNITDVMNELPWLREQVEEAISDEQAFFQI